MARLGTDLLALVESLDLKLGLPLVRRVFIPEPRINPNKSAEFGLVELEDSSCGLFYAWMGESQTGIAERFKTVEFRGASAKSIARYIAEDNDMARSIGLAAINALTQSLFKRCGFQPPDAQDSIAGLALDGTDRLGMVGNFPSIVRAACARDVAVTVVERKAHMCVEHDTYRITLEPSALSECNKIICTAATLINDSLDDMLTYCEHASSVLLLGPSASFFPDPAFTRGIDIIGGTEITDPAGAFDALQRGDGLAGVSRRYTIARDDYPGLTALLTHS